MKKIIMIGCPGSGKSHYTKILNKKLNYPVLNLDKIYHINNELHITSEELMQKVEKFANENATWIIDGNYNRTIEQRINLCDTIIYFDISTEICIKNVLERSKKAKTDDMADGFDISKIKQEFVDSVASFKKEKAPRILELINTLGKNKKVYIIKSYNEMDDLINAL